MRTALKAPVGLKKILGEMCIVVFRRRMLRGATAPTTVCFTDGNI